MTRVATDRKAVFFGELMMRLSTKRYERLVQAREFDVSYSGAEANLGVSLVQYGVTSYMVSSVPDNAIGEACLSYLRQFGLNLDHVKKNGFRLGIYYVEDRSVPAPLHLSIQPQGQLHQRTCRGRFRLGRDLRGKALVPFYRHHASPFGQCRSHHPRGLCRGEEAWRNGQRRSQLQAQALVGRKGRARRWATSCSTSTSCSPTRRRPNSLFGIKARGTDVHAGKLDEQGYRDVACQLVERFGFSHVSITLRGSVSASVNDWSGFLFDGKDFYTSRKYHIDPVVDRIGGGDAFSSGIIYGLLTGQDLQETVEFAAAASCLKHTIHGDFNLVSFDEIMELIHSGGSGPHPALSKNPGRLPTDIGMTILSSVFIWHFDPERWLV